MTTFTDDDKKLIKEIRSESAARTCETILSAGLMKLLWHHWKQKRHKIAGGFTIEEKKITRKSGKSHVSKALKWRKMKKENRDADLRWIHGVIVQAAWFVKASLGQNA